jgi:hypothetical protein
MYAGLYPEGDILNAVWKGKTAVERFFIPITAMPSSRRLP